jgi:hypothetical protein
MLAAVAVVMKIQRNQVDQVEMVGQVVDTVLLEHQLLELQTQVQAAVEEKLLAWVVQGLLL